MQGLALLHSFVPSVSRIPDPDPAVAGFLPKEHGSWSLVLEPLVLGLLVAPSFAGAALATTAFAGFLARRPLRTALAPTATPVRSAARRTVGLFSVLVAAGFGEVLVSAGWTSLWPLALAAPLGMLFAYFDAQGESRAAAAEVAGSAAFALLPAAFATLAGWTPAAALALAGLALARSVPTILVVRTYLRIKKGAVTGRRLPLAAVTVALLLMAVLAWWQLAPTAALGLGLLLWLRGGWFLSSFRPAWTARRIGMLEAGLGFLYVFVLTAAYAGFYP